MQKSVGLSRTVRLDWLDTVTFMCLEGESPAQIRARLDEMLVTAQPGAVERQRIVDTLVKAWVKAKPELQAKALDLFRQVSSRHDRICLHYGLILAQYPFFRVCTSAIGQISRTEEIISRPVIKKRVAAELGNLGSIERAIERLFKTLMDWEVLIPDTDKNQFRIQPRTVSASLKEMECWLLSSALRSHPSDAIPFEDLLRLPELFPFRFSVTIDDLRKSSAFEVQRQGGGLDMVKLSI